MKIGALIAGHRFAAHILAPVLRIKDTLQGGGMHRAQQRALEQLTPPEQLQDKGLIRRMKREMWYCYLFYRCTFKEYLLYDFYRLSPAGRSAFVTEKEKESVVRPLAKGNPRWELFGNKYQEYLTFQSYYRREAINADRDLSYDCFLAFIKAHPTFIVKPYGASCGKGVRFVDSTTAPAKELFEQLRTEDAILEEPIIQCQAMARFHPASVNTARIATFTKNGRVDILFTFLRMGRGNSIVDNGGSGGMVVPLDTDTGIVNGPGITEDKHSFLLHPDTGEQIIGFRVPRWEEAKALACELAMIAPEQPYIGWDLALTDDGWVMVEANRAGQFIGPQLTSHRGLRPLLSQYFDL